MTRRMIVCLSVLVGVIALVASASTATAQVPFTFDFAALLQSILDSLPAFLRDFVSGLFTAILNGFCAFFGTCSS